MKYKNMKWQKIAKMIDVFEKMNMVDISTDAQMGNGTYAFFDKEANCNFVFRQSSSPRVEYFSTKTNTVQSYKLFNGEGYLHKDMKTTIPYIVNRKVKGTKERARIAMEIAMKLMQNGK